MESPFFQLLQADVGDDVEPLINRLAARTSVARVERNDTLYLQGSSPDGIFVVVHGAVLLEWQRANGPTLGFRLALGGDNFGARSFCADEPRSATARAVRETQALRIPADELQHALHTDPRLWRPLARMVARDRGPRSRRSCATAVSRCARVWRT